MAFRRALLLVVVVAAAVRFPSLAAGYPYINYLDEGNVLHPALELVRKGGWRHPDPRQYSYPSLPYLLFTAPLRLAAPLYERVHGRSLGEDLSSPVVGYYDLLEPPELLLSGRAITLAAGLGIVVLAGLLGRRLGGTAAGALAALAAALVPALVARSGVVSVDAPAALFALACLVLTDRLTESARPAATAAAAGAMAGLALTCKYPAGLVGLSFAASVLAAPLAARRKVLLLAAGGAGGALAAALVMPDLLLRTRDVVAGLRLQGQIYGLRSPGLWAQAVRRAEWDLPLGGPELGWPFLLLAAAGLALALADRRLRRRVIGWPVFALALIGLVTRYPFQPFRNLLPLVAPASALVGLALARAAERSSRPRLAVGLAALALAGLLGPAALEHAVERAALVDSRRQAVDWLAGHAQSGDRVLVAAELALLRHELRRLPARPAVLRWFEARRQAVHGRGFRWLVTGELVSPQGWVLTPRARRTFARHYALRARFGEHPTPLDPSWWRGNRQVIQVFERRPAGRRSALRPGGAEGRAR
ncbi:MAG TPA: glycosyltransferase family 39 protein [Thermoanaerobaculia bacterium]|nr:glycosyltransferase family 39 protein [Thermoanaerobaculia bacterium]